MWDRLEGNRTNIEFLDSFVNFTDLRFNKVARSKSGYQLTFSFQALTGEFFTLDWCCVQVAPAKPAYLEVLNHPSGPRVGEAFASQALILIRDRFGNLVTGEFGDISAKLYQNDLPAPEGSVERIFGSNVASGIPLCMHGAPVLAAAVTRSCLLAFLSAHQGKIKRWSVDL